MAYEATYTPNTYTVKFNANGGSGTMNVESFTYDTAKALYANAFTRTDWEFLGWAESATETTAKYMDGQSVKNLATAGTKNLYAVWGAQGIQLWANGPYWATFNIGAENPEGYGYRFWWGDTIGCTSVNNKWVTSDGSSYFSFSDSNVPTFGKSIATLKSQGWITSNGVLAPAHDAAHVHWGRNWRMPTSQELSDLVDNCNWTKETRNGNLGYVVKGNGAYASASIFLPCAGRAAFTENLFYLDESGFYWSSVPSSGSSEISTYLYFKNSGKGTFNEDSGKRWHGLSVRPVRDTN